MSKSAAQLKGRAGRLARLMPSGPTNAARTPFVLLVVLLLGGGLIGLLLLNSALNEGSFRLSELKKETTELTDEQQALQRDVDGYSQPDALERRARELGMVPGGSPAFLDPDGTVRGVPAEVTTEPSPTPEPEPETSEPTVPAAPSDGTSPGATPTPDASEQAAGPPPAAPEAPGGPASGATGTTREAPAGPADPAAETVPPRTAATPPTTSPGR
ncbi:septum formation initiator [Streptomyces sp. BE308]|uniref:FtsB family cell division protein n=1 Tax=Streptomyces sp. BE308 TaxID=3002529 RepID=UPI002E7987A3|nr:septum formation initiator [Streptomyces sp. BE308]MEE1793202.1 septum formation initiator [Streptomyces sp. BE308]